MTKRAIVDAGPLVALLSARDHHHAWAKSVFTGVTPPAITCEAVLAEAWHLLRNTANGQIALLDLLAAGTLSVEFALPAELTAVRRLVARYRDRPMSLADACLVRLAELFDEARIFTVDKDFSVYRKHGRQAIPLVSPVG
jgi:predicted nucleic acid-binding protein